MPSRDNKRRKRLGPGTELARVGLEPRRRLELDDGALEEALPVARGVGAARPAPVRDAEHADRAADEEHALRESFPHEEPRHEARPDLEAADGVGLAAHDVAHEVRRLLAPDDARGDEEVADQIAVDAPAARRAEEDGLGGAAEHAQGPDDARVARGARAAPQRVREAPAGAAAVDRLAHGLADGLERGRVVAHEEAQARRALEAEVQTADGAVRVRDVVRVAVQPRLRSVADREQRRAPLQRRGLLGRAPREAVVRAGRDGGLDGRHGRRLEARAGGDAVDDLAALLLLDDGVADVAEAREAELAAELREVHGDAARREVARLRRHVDPVRRRAAQGAIGERESQYSRLLHREACIARAGALIPERCSRDAPFGVDRPRRL